MMPEGFQHFYLLMLRMRRENELLNFKQIILCLSPELGQDITSHPTAGAAASRLCPELTQIVHGS